VSFSPTRYSIFGQASSVASATESVPVGIGDGVGVGLGTSMVCPRLKTPQSGGRLFNSAILRTDTWKLKAIRLHVSPSLMEYSTGGSGVRVGNRVGVIVGVELCIKVGEGLIVAVGDIVAILPEFLRKRKIIPAPIARVNKINPRALGRLRETSGNRWGWIRFVEVPGGLCVKVLPQTGQRVAFSLSLVPQVGHTFVEEIFFSEFMF